MGQKNPGKFPPNFPLNFPNFPAKNQKKITDELLQERSSYNSHATPPKRPSDEEGLSWEWCVWLAVPIPSPTCTVVSKLITDRHFSRRNSFARTDTESCCKKNYQKNPRAHKNKIGTSPQKKPKIPPPPKTRNFMDTGFPAERTQFFQVSIKLAQPFPAPELRTRILRTRGFF